MKAGLKFEHQELQDPFLSGKECRVGKLFNIFLVERRVEHPAGADIEGGGQGFDARVDALRQNEPRDGSFHPEGYRRRCNVMGSFHHGPETAEAFYMHGPVGIQTVAATTGLSTEPGLQGRIQDGCVSGYQPLTILSSVLIFRIGCSRSIAT